MNNPTFETVLNQLNDLQADFARLQSQMLDTIQKLEADTVCLQDLTSGITTSIMDLETLEMDERLKTQDLVDRARVQLVFSDRHRAVIETLKRFSGTLELADLAKLTDYKESTVATIISEINRNGWGTISKEYNGPYVLEMSPPEEEETTADVVLSGFGTTSDDLPF